MADCLLVPTKTGDAAGTRQDLKLSITIGEKKLSASLTGDNGVVVRQGTKSTISLNVKDGDSKMEVESVGVDAWDDKVSGNTAEVDGHTVTFKCPEGLIYNLHLEQEASGSFDEQTSGSLKPVLTFSYDGSNLSVPQDKFLSVEGPASGCGFTFDKAAHTITVTDVTTDVSFNLSLGQITFIPYTATAKVEPKDKKIAGLPLNEEKSTFNGTSGTIAIEGKPTAISNEAFKDNKALTSITLPTGITAIGNDAFDGCTKLSLPALPSSIETIGSCAFRNAGSNTQDTPALVLPDNLTAISGYAFEGCRISSLTAGAKLSTVGSGVFKNCKLLTEMTFKSSSAPSLGGGDVFYGIDWSKVNGVFVNKSATGHSTLLNYKQADWWKDIANGIIREEGTTVTLIPYTATAKITLKTKDNPTDYSWGANTEYVWDESASRYDTGTGKGEWFFIGQGTAVPTKIPAEMFSDGFTADKTIQSITIPEGVLSIGKRAFTLCENLTSVSFPTTLTTIEAYGDYKYAIGVFQECYYLTAIDLSGCSNLKDIPIQCFRNCNRVTSLTLPENLESIGIRAFSYLGSATDVGLENITLPASLKTLGDNAFEHSKVKNVILYSNLEISQSGAMADYAFGNSTVESLTFENGASPGARMFNNCTKLKTITSKSATPPSLYYNGYFVFEGSTNIENVYVPSGRVDTYKTAAGWSQFANKIKAIGQ